MIDQQPRHHRRDLYNSSEWREMRYKLLEMMPYCPKCLSLGAKTKATLIDHIVPIPREFSALIAYDWRNLAPLCRACHSRKTVFERLLGRKYYKVFYRGTVVARYPEFLGKI